MEKAKIHLSANEWKMIRETDWIFIKKQITAKVYELLGMIADEWRLTVPENRHLPEEVRLSEPKITRGEQYKELPYVILDYPRVFGKEGVFAIRTMFWWGKTISVTLHLSGKYKQQYQPALLKNCQVKQYQYCCFEAICKDEWEHEIAAPYYLPVHEFTVEDLQQMITNSGFVKFAIPFALEEWNELPEKLLHAHQTLNEWLI
ncbi:hypothetical protein [Gynurincola endophyticus]|uniref:hypothetical protein n=1 Tax=Gynurincola endophyticus TaxID=2479004 RepID=UPI000F8DC6CF|nr:hypothetical protein [Gynurincola endophyticus]